MIAQAAHIPVHLGSMPMSVQEGIRKISFAPGDMVILNDPYRGGTHLPDITLIAPVFVPTAGEEEIFGFVASRAHHSDVGGMSPGSMSLSQEIFQEGIIIPPVKIMEGGREIRDLLDVLLANVRTPEERAGDLRAQMAANNKGIERMQEMVMRYGRDEVKHYMDGLLEYAERMTRRLIRDLPKGEFRFLDRMDDDGVDSSPAEIVVKIRIGEEEATVDFSGSSLQRKGSINAVEAITLSAVHYVFRAMIGLDIPSNSGCMKPIHVIAPRGTIVNAEHPAAVAGGNVETSQRIVDVLLGALAQAVPDKVPAASQGTMNNLTIGGYDPEKKQHYAYYETIGGGMGARPGKDGEDAIHTHMTNTLNTPIEAMEFAYPFLVRRYEIRRGSGGGGRFRGGDGICREIELLHEARVSLLSDRRRYRPYGLNGGSPGQVGWNRIKRNKEEIDLPGKTTVEVQKGDVISILTPGGGGHGDAT
jgi:N-methylhydantoinase B